MTAAHTPTACIILTAVASSKPICQSYVHAVPPYKRHWLFLPACCHACGCQVTVCAAAGRVTALEGSTLLVGSSAVPCVRSRFESYGVRTDRLLRTWHPPIASATSQQAWYAIGLDEKSSGAGGCGVVDGGMVQDGTEGLTRRGRSE